MAEIKKRPSEHTEPTHLKRQGSLKKGDIFSQFENSRQLFKDQSNENHNNSSNSNGKMMFNSKKKDKDPVIGGNQYDDQYGEDFQEAENLGSTKTKKKSEGDFGIQKKLQKKQESLKKLTLNRPAESKNPSRHRNAKSVVQTQPNNSSNVHRQPGRYESQIDKKFTNLANQQLSNEALTRYNEQIRDYIKKYNDILTELINKNLAQLTSKKKLKLTTPQDTIKVLREEIKNNAKIQEMDTNQLRKLEAYKQKLEQQQNYSETNMQEDITTHNNRIKQLKKQIYDMKLSVQNEGKKLAPTGNNFVAKKQNQSEVGILKQKLTVLRKDHERNQQKLTSLGARESQLQKKIENLGNIDKEADQLRTNSKKSQDKSKRFQEVKKKYDALKAHITKTEALWSTKSNVIDHENQSIRLKIKNIQLQIKNIEQSTKQVYQKSMKTITTTKPKNELNQKALDKIMSQMTNDNNNNNLAQKQMSLSQMKMLTRKKLSVDQMPLVKTGTGESQRNRVWKEEKKEDQGHGHAKEEDNVRLVGSKTEKNNLRVSQASVHESDKKSAPVENQKEHKTEVDQKQPQNSEVKPKKFNFNRNKANSQLATEQQTQTKPKQNPPPQTKKPEQKQNIQNQPQKPPANEQKQKQQQIKPKRFNLLRDRKSKDQASSSYLPSSTEPLKLDQPNQQNQKQKQKIDPPGESKQTNKPVFNLRKKRDTENREKLELDNEFMGN